MNFFLPSGFERPGLAMMCFGESGVAFELRNELVIGMRLLPREINVEDEQWNQAHDRNVVGGRAYLPQLSPVHKVPFAET